jgi:endonuclease-8
MPEGSDIYACAIYLKELLECTTNPSADVKVHFNPSNTSILEDIVSFGKKLRIQMKNFETIEIHLGLRGSLQMQVFTEIVPKRIPKYRIYFELADKRLFMLTVSDLSWGGHIEYVSSVALENPLILMDPLYVESDSQVFDHLIAMRNQNGRTILVNAITDQKKRFVGIGNFLAVEILYDARLLPRKKVNALTNDDLARLANSIIRLMKLHADRRLESLRATNLLGDNEERKGIIYHQKQDPDGHEVVADETIRSNRVFYWCPDVQV